MIKIGDKLLARNQTMEDTLKSIKYYLNKNRIILVDESDVPYSEEQIEGLLRKNDNIEFKVKKVDELVKETIEESLIYLNGAENKINEIILTKNQGEVTRCYPDIIEALDQLQHISNYFNSDIITTDKIGDLAKKGLSQMKEYNEEYLRELIEYECLPMLVEFKNFLMRGKPSC